MNSKNNLESFLDTHFCQMKSNRFYDRSLKLIDFSHSLLSFIDFNYRPLFSKRFCIEVYQPFLCDKFLYWVSENPPNEKFDSDRDNQLKNIEKLQKILCKNCSPFGNSYLMLLSDLDICRKSLKSFNIKNTTSSIIRKMIKESRKTALKEFFEQNRVHSLVVKNTSTKTFSDEETFSSDLFVASSLPIIKAISRLERATNIETSLSHEILKIIQNLLTREAFSISASRSNKSRRFVKSVFVMINDAFETNSDFIQILNATLNPSERETLPKSLLFENKGENQIFQTSFLSSAKKIKTDENLTPSAENLQTLIEKFLRKNSDVLFTKILLAIHKRKLSCILKSLYPLLHLTLRGLWKGIDSLWPQNFFHIEKLIKNKLLEYIGIECTSMDFDGRFEKITDSLDLVGMNGGKRLFPFFERKNQKPSYFRYGQVACDKRFFYVYKFGHFLKYSAGSDENEHPRGALIFEKRVDLERGFLFCFRERLFYRQVDHLNPQDFLIELDKNTFEVKKLIQKEKNTRMVDFQVTSNEKYIISLSYDLKSKFQILFYKLEKLTVPKKVDKLIYCEQSKLSYFKVSVECSEIASIQKSLNLWPSLLQIPFNIRSKRNLKQNKTLRKFDPSEINHYEKEQRVIVDVNGDKKWKSAKVIETTETKVNVCLEGGNQKQCYWIKKLSHKISNKTRKHNPFSYQSEISPQWCFYFPALGWRSFSIKESEEIEKLFLKEILSKLKIGKHYYHFDLNKMIAINMDTNSKIMIKRIEYGPPNSPKIAFLEDLILFASETHVGLTFPGGNFFESKTPTSIKFFEIPNRPIPGYAMISGLTNFSENHKNSKCNLNSKSKSNFSSNSNSNVKKDQQRFRNERIISDITYDFEKKEFVFYDGVSHCLRFYSDPKSTSSVFSEQFGEFWKGKKDVCLTIFLLKFIECLVNKNKFIFLNKYKLKTEMDFCYSVKTNKIIEILSVLLKDCLIGLSSNSKDVTNVTNGRNDEKSNFVFYRDEEYSKIVCSLANIVLLHLSVEGIEKRFSLEKSTVNDIVSLSCDFLRVKKMDRKAKKAIVQVLEKCFHSHTDEFKNIPILWEVFILENDWELSFGVFKAAFFSNFKSAGDVVFRMAETLFCLYLKAVDQGGVPESKMVYLTAGKVLSEVARVFLVSENEMCQRMFCVAFINAFERMLEMIERGNTHLKEIPNAFSELLDSVLFFVEEKKNLFDIEELVTFRNCVQLILKINNKTNLKEKMAKINKFKTFSTPFKFLKNLFLYDVLLKERSFSFEGFDCLIAEVRKVVGYSKTVSVEIEGENFIKRVILSVGDLSKTVFIPANNFSVSCAYPVQQMKIDFCLNVYGFKSGESQGENLSGFGSSFGDLQIKLLETASEVFSPILFPNFKLKSGFKMASQMEFEPTENYKTFQEIFLSLLEGIELGLPIRPVYISTENYDKLKKVLLTVVFYYCRLSEDLKQLKDKNCKPEKNLAKFALKKISDTLSTLLSLEYYDQKIRNYTPPENEPKELSREEKIKKIVPEKDVELMEKVIAAREQCKNKIAITKLIASDLEKKVSIFFKKPFAFKYTNAGQEDSLRKQKTDMIEKVLKSLVKNSFVPVSHILERNFIKSEMDSRKNFCLESLGLILNNTGWNLTSAEILLGKISQELFSRDLMGLSGFRFLATAAFPLIKRHYRENGAENSLILEKLCGIVSLAVSADNFDYGGSDVLEWVSNVSDFTLPEKSLKSLGFKNENDPGLTKMKVKENKVRLLHADESIALVTNAIVYSLIKNSEEQKCKKFLKSIVERFCLLSEKIFNSGERIRNKEIVLGNNEKRKLVKLLRLIFTFSAFAGRFGNNIFDGGIWDLRFETNLVAIAGTFCGFNILELIGRLFLFAQKLDIILQKTNVCVSFCKILSLGVGITDDKITGEIIDIGNKDSSIGNKENNNNNNSENEKRLNHCEEFHYELSISSAESLRTTSLKIFSQTLGKFLRDINPIIERKVNEGCDELVYRYAKNKYGGFWLSTEIEEKIIRDLKYKGKSVLFRGRNKKEVISFAKEIAVTGYSTTLKKIMKPHDRLSELEECTENEKKMHYIEKSKNCHEVLIQFVRMVMKSDLEVSRVLETKFCECLNNGIEAKNFETVKFVAGFLSAISSHILGNMLTTDKTSGKINFGRIIGRYGDTILAFDAKGSIIKVDLYNVFFRRTQVPHLETSTIKTMAKFASENLAKVHSKEGEQFDHNKLVSLKLILDAMRQQDIPFEVLAETKLVLSLACEANYKKYKGVFFRSCTAEKSLFCALNALKKLKETKRESFEKEEKNKVIMKPRYHDLSFDPRISGCIFRRKYTVAKYVGISNMDNLKKKRMQIPITLRSKTAIKNNSYFEVTITPLKQDINDPFFAVGVCPKSIEKDGSQPFGFTSDSFAFFNNGKCAFFQQTSKNFEGKDKIEIGDVFDVNSKMEGEKVWERGVVEEKSESLVKFRLFDREKNTPLWANVQYQRVYKHREKTGKGVPGQFVFRNFLEPVTFKEGKVTVGCKVEEGKVYFSVEGSPLKMAYESRSLEKTVHEGGILAAVAVPRGTKAEINFGQKKFVLEMSNEEFEYQQVQELLPELVSGESTLQVPRRSNVINGLVELLVNIMRGSDRIPVEIPDLSQLAGRSGIRSVNVMDGTGSFEFDYNDENFRAGNYFLNNHSIIFIKKNKTTENLDSLFYMSEGSHVVAKENSLFHALKMIWLDKERRKEISWPFNIASLASTRGKIRKINLKNKTALVVFGGHLNDVLSKVWLPFSALKPASKNELFSREPDEKKIESSVKKLSKLSLHMSAEGLLRKLNERRAKQIESKIASLDPTVMASCIENSIKGYFDFYADFKPKRMFSKEGFFRRNSFDYFVDPKKKLKMAKEFLSSAKQTLPETCEKRLFFFCSDTKPKTRFSLGEYTYLLWKKKIVIEGADHLWVSQLGNFYLPPNTFLVFAADEHCEEVLHVAKSSSKFAQTELIASEFWALCLFLQPEVPLPGENKEFLVKEVKIYLSVSTISPELSVGCALLASASLEAPENYSKKRELLSEKLQNPPEEWAERRRDVVDCLKSLCEITLLSGVSDQIKIEIWRLFAAVYLIEDVELESGSLSKHYKFLGEKFESVKGFKKFLFTPLIVSMFEALVIVLVKSLLRGKSRTLEHEDMDSWIQECFERVDPGWKSFSPEFSSATLTMHEIYHVLPRNVSLVDFLKLSEIEQEELIEKTLTELKRVKNRIIEIANELKIEPENLTQKDIFDKEKMYYDKNPPLQESDIKFVWCLNKSVVTEFFMINVGEGYLGQLVRFVNCLFYPTVKDKFTDDMLLATAKARGATSQLISIDRIGSKNKNPLFSQLFEQLKYYPTDSLKVKPYSNTSKDVAFNVKFKNEDALGNNGPYRELFEGVFAEMFSSENGPGLFQPTPNFVHEVGEDRFLFVPLTKEKLTPQKENEYRFLGKMMGTAFRSKILLPLFLPRMFYSLLVGAALRRKDLEQIDFSLCQSLLIFLENLKNKEEFDILDLDLSFDSNVEKFCAKSLVGKKVTFETRLDYVQAVESFNIEKYSRGFRVICEGFRSVVPASVLSFFTPEEIEFKICGTSKIDLQLLKNNSVYKDCSETDGYVQNFWAALAELGPEELSRFVEFAYASRRLPLTDAEFKTRGIRMQIRPFQSDSSRTDEDSLLPKAETCFFNVTIPRYSSKEVALKMIRKTLSFGWGMSGDELMENFNRDLVPESLARARRGFSSVVRENLHVTAPSSHEPAGQPTRMILRPAENGVQISRIFDNTNNGGANSRNNAPRRTGRATRAVAERFGPATVVLQWQTRNQQAEPGNSAREEPGSEPGNAVENEEFDVEEQSIELYLHPEMVDDSSPERYLGARESDLVSTGESGNQDDSLYDFEEEEEDSDFALYSSSVEE